MKRVRGLLLLGLVLVLAPLAFSPALAGGATRGEEIVQSFIRDKSLQVEPGTDRYLQLMKDIMLGQFPELTGSDSVYVAGQEDLDAVLEYATEQMSPLFEGWPQEPDVPEATLPAPAPESTAADGSILAYNRTNAINYAYAWWNGQNAAYPDFGSNDCTNFISQCVRAGGMVINGTGDGCRDESTTTEWYVEANSPPIWCLGSNRNWEWSSSWTVVYDFRVYFTVNNSFATTLGWTINPDTAKSLLSPGDLVQLQTKQGDSWVSYHNMIVTKETTTDLLMTYHSTDTKDKKLRDIPAGDTQRYLLIRYN